MTELPKCRSCGTELSVTLVDLGLMPLANTYPTADDLAKGAPKRYPLRVRVCPECYLVQADEAASREELFEDYAYFSSYSGTWLAHARRFASKAVAEYRLGPDSLVVEAASNDGYLLQYFASMGIPVLGVEPAKNVARVAIEAGIPTETVFFGLDTALDIRKRISAADLFVANNVLAHNPDIHDFVSGVAAILAPEGVASIEIPHLERLLAEVQFDTIYHEHFYYFSLLSLEPVLRGHGLRVFDVVRLETHGGSLRVLCCLEDARTHPELPGVQDVRDSESAAGLDEMDTYRGFEVKVAEIRNRLRGFIEDAKAADKMIAAYGAAAKGNTLLNYCGVDSSEIAFVADRNPYKQGRFLPGTHIPIREPEAIEESKPDYVLILPWNLADEIIEQLSGIRGWGGRFVIPVPELQIVE